MPKRFGPISDQLKGVAGRLKRWREAHEAKTRLPDELWAAAVQAAGEEGIYRTAHSLRLDYGNLKRKVESSTKATKAPAKTASDKRSIAPAKTASGNRSMEAAKMAFGNRAPTNRGAQPGAFMELIAGSMGSDCLIELDGVGRGRMRIQMKLTAPDVISLVRGWLDGAIDYGEGQS